MSPQADRPEAGIRKRSVVLNGHGTSVSLEDAFWTALAEIARADGLTLQALIEQVDSRRSAGNLSSALRLHALAYFRGKAG